MNYYNPYIYTMPTSFMPTQKVGLLTRLLGGRSISFGSILSGTQKTLNVVNQTIPLVKQVHPIMKNAKTMFKVMNEFKKSNNFNSKTKPSINNNYSNNSNNSNQVTYDNGPTFFI